MMGEESSEVIEEKNADKMSQIDTRGAALVLIEIAYQQGHINQATYNNIIAKYGNINKKNK